MIKVLCPGEALIDFVAIEKNSLTRSSEFIKKAGGAPANAAAAMTKFGVMSLFLGNVGDDPFGYFLKDKLEQNNIDTTFLTIDKNNFTTLAFVSLNHDGERDFVFNRGADQKCKFPEIKKITDIEGFHFASATAFLGGQLEQTYMELLEFAISNNKFISFDANYRSTLFTKDDQEYIKKCINFISKSTIVKLSEEELYIISEEQEFDVACKKVINFGCNYLIITMGKEGSYLYTKKDNYHIPSIKVKPIDTTGAGDAFIGSVIAGAISENELDDQKMVDIISYANKVGALTTSKYGALESIPTKEEIENID